MKTPSSFWYSPTYRIIKAMQATGNGPGVIRRWLEPVAQWAESAAGPDAEALRAWLPLFQHRPFYTAEELAPIFPALAVAMNLAPKLYAPKDPKRLYHELTFGKLPILTMSDGSRDYTNPQTGRMGVYFIVERLHFWSSMHLTQQEFENVIEGSAHDAE